MKVLYVKKEKEKQTLKSGQTLQNKHFSPFCSFSKLRCVGNQIGRVWTIARMAFEGEKQVGFVTFVHGALYEAMARLPPLRLKFLVLAETVDQPSSSMVSAVV